LSDSDPRLKDNTPMPFTNINGG